VVRAEHRLEVGTGIGAVHTRHVSTMDPILTPAAAADLRAPPKRGSSVMASTVAG
jgi:hypothetical protein